MAYDGNTNFWKGNTFHSLQLLALFLLLIQHLQHRSIASLSDAIADAAVTFANAAKSPDIHAAAQQAVSDNHQSTKLGYLDCSVRKLWLMMEIPTSEKATHSTHYSCSFPAPHPASSTQIYSYMQLECCFGWRNSEATLWCIHWTLKIKTTTVTELDCLCYFTLYSSYSWKFRY